MAGVYLHAHSGKWNAFFSRNGRWQSAGYFADEEAAARAHDAAVTKAGVPNAVLNFLPDGSLNPDRFERCK
jgi:hypothetical protein